jgi:hypothetical protein
MMMMMIKIIHKNYTAIIFDTIKILKIKQNTKHNMQRGTY